MSWAEIARRLGTYPNIARRWWRKCVQPDAHHIVALLDLAGDPGLGHLFTRLMRRAAGAACPLQWGER